jgi:hypothetical protein
MSVHIRWWRGWRKVADNQDNTPGYLILYRRWNEQNDQEKDGVHALKYTLAGRRHGTREMHWRQRGTKVELLPFSYHDGRQIFFFFISWVRNPWARFTFRPPPQIQFAFSLEMICYCVRLVNQQLPELTNEMLRECLRVWKGRTLGRISISDGIHRGKINGPDRFSFFGTLATSLWFSNTRPSYNPFAGRPE